MSHMAPVRKERLMSRVNNTRLLSRKDRFQTTTYWQPTDMGYDNSITSRTPTYPKEALDAILGQFGLLRTDQPPPLDLLGLGEEVRRKS